MKRLFCLLFVFGFVFAICSAQDLGELAKKEKARREAIAKTGKKSKTLTNADIPNIKSDLAIKQTAPATGETEATEATASEPATETESESAVSTETSADDQKLEQMKKEKEQAEQEAKEARDQIGKSGLFNSQNIGSQYQKAREAEKKAEELEKKIEKKDTSDDEQE